MITWLQNWWAEFLQTIADYWQNVQDFLLDIPKLIFEGVLGALASVIEALPVPDFVQTNGLAVAVGALGNDIQYLLAVSGFAVGLGILGSGFAFRLLRKAVTLFQW